jgi:hypothetical protein
MLQEAYPGKNSTTDPWRRKNYGMPTSVSNIASRSSGMLSFEWFTESRQRQSKLLAAIGVIQSRRARSRIVKEALMDHLCVQRRILGSAASPGRDFH